MTFVTPDNTWFGIALGKKDMYDANIIRVKADGNNSKIDDLYSKQPGQEPSPTTVNKLTGSFEKKNGSVTFKVSRALDTQDPQHYAFVLDTEVPMGWAANTQTSMTSMQHTIAGNFMMTLKSDGSTIGATALAAGVAAITLLTLF